MKYDVEMSARYINILMGLNEDPFSDDKRLSHNNLLWMCLKVVEMCEDWPQDKIGRWIGFVQGVLASQGAIDVDEERDATREILHKKYEECGNSIPITMCMEQDA